MEKIRDAHKQLIGGNLKRIRKENGMSLEKLAEKIGSDKQYLSRIERGLAGMGNGIATRLSEALGVPIAEFTRGIVSESLHEDPYVNQFLNDLIAELSSLSESERLRRIADLKEVVARKG